MSNELADKIPPSIHVQRVSRAVNQLTMNSPHLKKIDEILANAANMGLLGIVIHLTNEELESINDWHYYVKKFACDKKGLDSLYFIEWANPYEDTK